jgi:hypothetical protein
MFSSMTSTCVGTAQAPALITWRYAAAASRTRSAIAAMTGLSSAAPRAGQRAMCALTITFMSPCR